MNKEEILALEIGKELDHLVMKEIFNASMGYYGDEEVWYHYDSSGEPDYEWSIRNRPSTDISAAWEVLASAQKNGWMLYKLANTVSGVGNIDGYICRLLHTESGASREMTADTETEAICKAVLLTMVDV